MLILGAIFVGIQYSVLGSVGNFFFTACCEKPVMNGKYTSCIARLLPRQAQRRVNGCRNVARSCIRNSGSEATCKHILKRCLHDIKGPYGHKHR